MVQLLVEVRFSHLRVYRSVPDVQRRLMRPLRKAWEAQWSDGCSWSVRWASGAFTSIVRSESGSGGATRRRSVHADQCTQFGQGLVAGVDAAQGVRQGPGRIGDDVGVAGVGLRGPGCRSACGPPKKIAACRARVAT